MDESQLSISPAPAEPLDERFDAHHSANEPDAAAWRHPEQPDEFIDPALLEPPAPDEIRHIFRDDAALVIDAALQKLGGREAACRVQLGRHSRSLLERRGYHRLGFARLRDYTAERLGISARELQVAAQVARALDNAPNLESAFREGRLSWSKLRALARLVDTDAQASTTLTTWWVRRASTLTVAEVDRAVALELARRAELGGASPSSQPETDLIDDADSEPHVELNLPCKPALLSLWRQTCELASRTAGSPLGGWQTLELVAAEALSARPFRAEQTIQGTSAGVDGADSTLAPRPQHRGLDATVRAVRADGSLAPHAYNGGLLHADSDTNGAVSDACHEFTDQERAAMREQISPHSPSADFARGASAAAAAPSDAGEDDDQDPCNPQNLDCKLRAILGAMQSIDYQMGKLLHTFTRLRLHRHLGYTSLSSYVTERIGISPRKARTLVQLVGAFSERRGLIADAYRDGKLSWVRAIALLPVAAEQTAKAWTQRAREVTVRRLIDEVSWARDIHDRTSFLVRVGPPPSGAALNCSADEELRRHICSHYGEATADRILSHGQEVSAALRIRGPASVISLACDAIETFRVGLEAPHRAFERILRHALEVWSDVPRHRNPIFDRDGWRCRVPACSSRRNLHEHHIVFRSHGGGNQRGNRVAICAWHHLRGIHGGVVRAAGDANRSIHWQLGVNGKAETATPLIVTDDDAYRAKHHAGPGGCVPRR